MHRKRLLTGSEKTKLFLKNRIEIVLLERYLVDLTRIEGIHPIIAVGVDCSRGKFEKLMTKKLFLLWLKSFAKWGSVEGFLEGRRQRF
jgi:hypothetical protein